MSVNDLTREDHWYRVLCDEYEEAADHVEEVASRVWHPASDPPTEEDSEGSHVMCVMANGVIASINYALVSEYGKAIGPWARIRDVVLRPPEGSP